MEMGATLQAVSIQAGFFVLSILGAWVVLRLLKGTAQIQQKGVQLGGAAAMFVTMFILLNRYVPDMREGIIQEAAAAPQTLVTKNAGASSHVDVAIHPYEQRITKREFGALIATNTT
jgi:hypothetical protein